MNLNIKAHMTIHTVADQLTRKCVLEKPGKVVIGPIEMSNAWTDFQRIQYGSRIVRHVRAAHRGCLIFSFL